MPDETFNEKNKAGTREISKNPFGLKFDDNFDGRYRILEFIGCGGMACVYKAYFSLTDTIVALKLMRFDINTKSEADKRDCIQRFLQEGRIAQTLTHEGIIRIHHIDRTTWAVEGEEKEIYYLSMKFLEGHNLEDWRLQQETPVPVETVVDFGLQICNILSYPHSMNLIHRDIKPRNIMVCPANKLVLLDFGLVKPIDRLSKEKPHYLVGSLGYIPPEQLPGLCDEGICIATDVYPVGIILYELLRGNNPQLRIREINDYFKKKPSPDEFHPVHLFRDDVPEALDKVIRKAIQPKPSQRYQNAEIMHRDLAAISLPGRRFIPSFAKKRGEDRRKSRMVKTADESVDIGLTDDITIKMRRIEPGTFIMGAAGEHSSDTAMVRPVKVKISIPFLIGCFPVTQRLWEHVMSDNPSFYKNCPKCPVESVCWDDCLHFLEELNRLLQGWNFRLPTEAEWEYCCRAGERNIEIENLDEIAWHFNNSGIKTHPAGQKKPNQWMLYDMLGNVREWCMDWYGEYKEEEETDPRGPVSGAKRVLRGGAFSDYPELISPAARFRDWPFSEGYNDSGLRLVADAI